MKMNEIVNMLPSLLVGVFLGTIFFGGLWLTVRKGLNSKKSALIFTGSFIIRITITLIGFYFVVQYGWEKMLVCLAGFLIARVVIVYLTRKTKQPAVEIFKEAQHET